MRSLVISIIVLGLLMGSWGVFLNRADKAIHEMSASINEEILPAVSAEDWRRSQERFSYMSTLWNQDRRLFSIYFDAISIGQIEGSLARAKEYLQSEEKSSASGELAYLDQQLLFVLENERLSLENAL